MWFAGLFFAVRKEARNRDNFVFFLFEVELSTPMD
jgi:hypothetical protein